MRMRFLLWAAILAGGFYYVTSVARWDVRRFTRPASGASPLWRGPDAVKGAGFSSEELNNIDIYKTAHAATANITSIVYAENWFFQVYPQRGTGSGFIVTEDGHILTNHHVVAGNAQLTVTLANKKQYKARVLGIDRRNDLALVKIDPREKLPVLKLGESDGLRVGQKVLAIGNPFGLEGTLTTGVVSSIGRTIAGESGRALEDMIQTDAAINPGNSGGPLLDSHGFVIGINTAIYGPEGNIGIGFAMPINRAKAMLDEFRTRGYVARPVLGIETVRVAGDLARELDLPEEGGLLVQRVDRGSPAEEAGIRGPRRIVIVGNYPLGIGGDLIVALDGKPVSGEDSVQRALARKRGGDMMELTVYRNGRTQKIQVKLGSAPDTL